jgi:hypothetical protein
MAACSSYESDFEGQIKSAAKKYEKYKDLM